jgi:VIT1/CCC1 family predicted Fe2+/Mn2+ transporter
MSTMTPSTLNDDRTTTLLDAAGRAARSLRGPVQALGFWSAVLLPFASLYLLSDGLTGAELAPLVALLVSNALALVVGHDHRR